MKRLALRAFLILGIAHRIVFGLRLQLWSYDLDAEYIHYLQDCLSRSVPHILPPGTKWHQKTIKFRVALHIFIPVV